MRGTVRGRLDDPQIDGVVRAERLRYAGFDFKGGELSVNYRGGTVAVEGWVAARENRLRAGRGAGQGLALRVGSRAAAVRPGTGPLGARRAAAGAGPGSGESLLPGHRAAPGQRAAARSRLGAGRPAAGHAVAPGRRDIAAEPRARADLLARRGARGGGFPAGRRTVPPVGSRGRERRRAGGTCRPKAR